MISCGKGGPRRFGNNYQHRIPLQACLTCECPFRGRCKDYKAVDPNIEVEAMADASAHGHAVTVERLPLLEVVR